MVNPTSAPVPNQFTTPNVPNTLPAVQIIGVNGARNALLVSNISGNILWLGPPTVVAVSGTIQQGQISLAAGATIVFGAMAGIPGAAALILIPWVWTNSMFAIAAAGATNAVTVLEF